MIAITFESDFDNAKLTLRELAEWFNANRSECDRVMPITGLKNKMLTVNACKILMRQLDAQIEMEAETDHMTDEEFKAWVLAGTVEETEEEKAKADKPVRQASNSAGISASWKDESIKKARTTRNRVHVSDGNTQSDYRSCAAAFASLGLNDSKCIRFRMKLKKSGREVFEQDGKSYTFTLMVEEK